MFSIYFKFGTIFLILSFIALFSLSSFSLMRFVLMLLGYLSVIMFLMDGQSTSDFTFLYTFGIIGLMMGTTGLIVAVKNSNTIKSEIIRQDTYRFEHYIEDDTHKTVLHLMDGRTIILIGRPLTRNENIRVTLNNKFIEPNVYQAASWNYVKLHITLETIGVVIMLFGFIMGILFEIGIYLIMGIGGLCLILAGWSTGIISKGFWLISGIFVCLVVVLSFI